MRVCSACTKVDRGTVTDGGMQVAAMKFLFHHGRNGVMRTVDLLVSPVMAELQRVASCIERGRIDTINGGSWFSKKVGLPWLQASHYLHCSQFDSVQWWIYLCHVSHRVHLPNPD